MVHSHGIRVDSHWLGGIGSVEIGGYWNSRKVVPHAKGLWKNLIAQGYGNPKKHENACPIGSMGLVYLPTFNHKNQLNVGKYAIHGSSGC